MIRIEQLSLEELGLVAVKVNEHTYCGNSNTVHRVDLSCCKAEELHFPLQIDLRRIVNADIEQIREEGEFWRPPDLTRDGMIDRLRKDQPSEATGSERAERALRSCYNFNLVGMEFAVPELLKDLIELADKRGESLDLVAIINVMKETRVDAPEPEKT